MLESNPLIVLACSLGCFFAKVCVIARATCHVHPIGPQLVPSSYHRYGAWNKYPPVPIGPAIHAPEAEMLGQTETQTGPDSSIYFTLSPGEISEQLRSSTTILSPLVTYNDNDPAMYAPINCSDKK